MTRITGHRGARNLWPENSLAGFVNTLELDVDAIEFDVHLTGAGELVVIHDATLDRTTEGRGPVRDLTPEARGQLRLKGCDETVPTLAEVLNVLASQTSKRLHVEIKSDADGRPYPGIVEKVVAELDRAGASERSYLTSFDVSVLEECRDIAPDVARLVSVNATWAERQGGLDAFLDRVDDLVDIIAIHHELMAQEWGLITGRVARDRLCVWTLNDEAPIRDWIERGIGHLTSDRPDLALALRAQAAAGRLHAGV